MSVENAMANFESDQSSNSIDEVSETSSVGARMSSIMDADYDVDDKKTPQEPNEENKKDKTPIKNDKDEDDEKVKKTEKKETEKEEKGKDQKDKDQKKEDKEKDGDKEKKDSEKKLIKYKVDGVEIEEEVDEQELINNFSGRKSLQKKFTQLDIERKAFQKERDALEIRNKTIENYLDSNKAKFEKIISNFEKKGIVEGDPTEAFFDMIDKMELDVSKYDKAMFFHYVPLVADFLDMSDAERKAFLLEKDNGWFRKKQESFAQKEEANRQYRAKLESENSAKREAGLSEEQFIELKEELQSMLEDGAKIDVSKVLEWHKIKPSFLRAKSLVDKAGKGNVWKLTGLISEYPDTTDIELLTALGYKENEQKKLETELKDKIPNRPIVAKKQKVDFDEEDLELIKQFRR